jgi:hypothetical protein
VPIERFRWTAGLALVPQAAQSFDVFPAKLLLELPIAQSLPHDLAGCRALARFDDGLEGGDSLACQRDADFLHIGHGAVPLAAPV